MAAGLRLPLYPAEARAAPTTVVVTGATGFLAGPLVARLLVAGAQHCSSAHSVVLAMLVAACMAAERTC